MNRLVLASLVVAALAGCAVPTQFIGDAKVKGGPAGCKAVCDAWGMELAGMVRMGEYSDGCICQVRAKPGAAPSSPAAPQSPSASAAGGPTAGVWMQMVAAAAAAQQSAHIGATGPGGGPDARHPYVPGSPIGSPGWRPGLP